MSEKPTIFRSFQHLGGNSNPDNQGSKEGNTGDKEKKGKSKSKLKREARAQQGDLGKKGYTSINFEKIDEYSREKPSITGRGSKDNEEIKLELTDEERSKYKHFNSYDAGKPIVSGIPEYRFNPKDYKQAGKIFEEQGKSLFQKKLLKQLSRKTLKRLSYPESNTKPEENNDIMSSVSMPEPGEPKIIPIEKNTLSAEDLQLQKAVYKSVERSKKYLNNQLAINKKDERLKNDLKEFEQSPYFWMKMDLNKRIAAGMRELNGPINETEKVAIFKKMVENQKTLDNLNLAMQKDLPLKLDRKFTKEKISVGSRSFEVKEYTKELNEKLGITNTNYEIIGVVQRGNGDFVVFKNERGVESEVDMAVLEKIAKEKDPVYIKKQEDIKRIKVGDIVAVRAGGEGGKRTRFKIIEIKDGKILFDNLTAREESKKVTRGEMTLEHMQKQLLDDRTDFFIKEDLKVEGSPGTKVPEKEPEEPVSQAMTESATNEAEVKLTAEEIEEFKQMLKDREQRKQKIEKLKQDRVALEEALKSQIEKDKKDWENKLKDEEELRKVSPSTADLVNLLGADTVNESMEALREKITNIERRREEELNPKKFIIDELQKIPDILQTNIRTEASRRVVNLFRNAHGLPNYDGELDKLVSAINQASPIYGPSIANALNNPATAAKIAIESINEELTPGQDLHKEINSRYDAELAELEKQITSSKE